MKYFIVFYKAMYVEKGLPMSKEGIYEPMVIYDDLLIKTKNYPNKKTTIKALEEDYGYRWVHITGINEVTKEESEKYYE